MAQMQRQESPILTEYQKLLQTEWRYSVACQDQCESEESCSCQRYIVHVEAALAWLKRQTSGGTEDTTLHRVVEEVQRAKHRKFPLDFRIIFEGDYRCLRIFSRLIEQGCGPLIDQFYKSNVHDHFLERGEEYHQLRENLAEHMSNPEVDTIITQFQKTRWPYCPLTLTLHMERSLSGTRVIVPFCRKIKLTEGGTASVYWVAVQKELIHDEKLRAILQKSLYTDPNFGDVSLRKWDLISSSNPIASVTKWR